MRTVEENILRSERYVTPSGGLTRDTMSIPSSTESAIDDIIRLSVILLEHLLLNTRRTAARAGDALAYGPSNPRNGRAIAR